MISTAWGWAILIVGIVQFLAALAIFSQQSWGAVVGIIVASLGAIGQLLYLGVDPWWSIIVIAIDILVIYALAMHGFPEGRDTAGARQRWGEGNRPGDQCSEPPARRISVEARPYDAEVDRGHNCPDQTEKTTPARRARSTPPSCLCSSSTEAGGRYPQRPR